MSSLFMTGTAYDREWVPYQNVGASINGLIPFREWGILIPTEEVLRTGSNQDEIITRLEVFFQTLPTKQLHNMCTSTNSQLA